MNLRDRLTEEHQPSTPRTHDGQGHKIEEPAQCRKCLQSWPCDTRQLLDEMQQVLDEVADYA